MLAQRLCNLHRDMASSQKHWENIPWSSCLCICMSIVLQLLLSLSSCRCSDEIRMCQFCRFLVWWLQEKNERVCGFWLVFSFVCIKCGEKSKLDHQSCETTGCKIWHGLSSLDTAKNLPLMISSFTLCNSRTTSSKISCKTRFTRDVAAGNKSAHCKPHRVKSFTVCPIWYTNLFHPVKFCVCFTGATNGSHSATQTYELIYVHAASKAHVSLEGFFSV